MLLHAPLGKRAGSSSHAPAGPTHIFFRLPGGQDTHLTRFRVWGLDLFWGLGSLNFRVGGCSCFGVWGLEGLVFRVGVA